MSDSRMMVMVASLERHLREERKIVFEAICGQSAIPVGLAFPLIPANYIYKLNLQLINDADYIALIVGSEYGALTDKGVGYIHATYAAAQAARKPVISLIYSGDKQVTTDKFDGKRLEGLHDILKTGNVYYWNDSDSLRDVTEQALEKVFENHPSVGWIKADFEPLVPDSNHVDQNIVAKLKNQVTNLQRKLTTAKESRGPVDVPSFEGDLKPWNIAYNCNAFREGRLKKFNGKLVYDLQEAFEWLSPSLLAPVTESRLKTTLASRIHDPVLSNAQFRWPGCHAVSDVKVEQASIDNLKVRLRTLGVIGFDSQGRWKLTEGGELLALQKES